MNSTRRRLAHGFLGLTAALLAGCAGGGGPTLGYIPPPEPVREFQAGLTEGRPLTPGWIANARELGVSVVRCSGALGADWRRIQTAPGQFDWSALDEQITALTHAGITPFVNITGERSETPNALGFRPTRLTHNPVGYELFVEELVERYDGDGDRDAPGSPVVGYWQIENEIDTVHWDDSPENYAVLLSHAARAIRRANPKAVIVLAGASPEESAPAVYERVLQSLTGVTAPPGGFFDVFDFHVFGTAGGDYQAIGELAVYYRDMLRHYGFTGVSLMLTETATYSGRPAGNWPEQTEHAQAADLVKRFAHALANGVTGFFWVSLEEWSGYGGQAGGYFDRAGLVHNPVHDGQLGPKAAFYTMRQLIRELDKARFTGEAPGLPQGVYGALFERNYEDILILWSDRPTEDPILVMAPWKYSSGLIRPLITEGPGPEETWIHPARNGLLALRVGPTPLLVTRPSY